MKKLYTIFVGVSILQFCFGVGYLHGSSFTRSWIHSLISGIGVYVLIRFANQKKQPIYVFFFSLLYLSFSYFSLQLAM